LKARNFNYAKPTDLPEALALLAADDAVAIAGGQSLLAGMNLRLSSPKLLVDISALDALRGISEDDESVEIRALTRHFEIIDTPLVKARTPLLAEAATYIAHEAVRSRGTIGGSLAYADPSAELPACAVALGATLVLESATGRRFVRAEDFFKTLFETDLRPSELIVAIRFPKPLGSSRYSFDEIARRSGDFAMAGLIVVVPKDLDPPRFVYFGCSDRPRLATNIARLAWNHDFTADDPPSFMDVLQDDVDPSDSVGCRADTKLKLASTLTRRAMVRMQRGLQDAVA
jgi:carbon-monoxide dehydrogenase medium subunit